jgi:hypothetical protein
MAQVTVVKPDNVDDTNLKRFAGTSVVSVAATKRPAEVTKALLDVSRADLEYDAAQVAENHHRQALASALGRTAEAAQAVQRARRAYDAALLLERKMRIDPAEPRSAL